MVEAWKPCQRAHPYGFTIKIPRKNPFSNYYSTSSPQMSHKWVTSSMGSCHGQTSKEGPVSNGPSWC